MTLMCSGSSRCVRATCKNCGLNEIWWKSDLQPNTCPRCGLRTLEKTPTQLYTRLPSSDGGKGNERFPQLPGLAVPVNVRQRDIPMPVEVTS